MNLEYAWHYSGRRRLYKGVRAGIMFSITWLATSINICRLMQWGKIGRLLTRGYVSDLEILTKIWCFLCVDIGVLSLSFQESLNDSLFNASCALIPTRYHQSVYWTTPPPPCSVPYCVFLLSHTAYCINLNYHVPNITYLMGMPYSFSLLGRIKPPQPSLLFSLSHLLLHCI